MDSEQARATLAAIDNHDRAVANLRNAAAMMADDTRATPMLEEAGDAYGAAVAKLNDVEVAAMRGVEAPSLMAPEGRDPGIALYIVKGGTGAGFVAPNRPEGTDPGSIVLRLTCDARFRGEDYPAGSEVVIPEDCLSDVPPEGASTTKTPDAGKDTAKA
jgi:hypothetical protein